ncbi:zinc finger protein 668-like [Leguminivora glycinivorella]|uniref:zinc finger protein 668-like n=1 Tax=Leguminivora glycinivorella TaxID=1035111 RepID=UPI00200E6FA3|nr:zinc finger protein 668-like [Leguminivora glycinivorella]
MANEEELQNPLSVVNVVIKSEPIEHVLEIKLEPLDEEETGPEEFNSSVKEKYEEGTVDEFVSDAPEEITIKVEPTFYSSDDELDLASYVLTKAQETASQQNFFTLSPHVKKPRIPRKAKDQDEDYMPSKKKKKIKNNVVKKPFTNKTKKKENCYSDEVNKNIELVTITEEERQIEFRELWQTRKHMRYFCGDCAIGFVMEEPYLTHMKGHAPESGEFMCEICRCRGNNKEQMYKHKLRHYRRYRCGICKRVFKDKETASSHVMSEHVHEAFTCGECGKGFRRPAYLKKHVAQQHTKEQEHECPICERVFFHRSMYNTHVRRHNEEVRNPINQLFICDLCSKHLKTKQALRRHLAIHEKTRNIPCSLCPSVFHTKKGLRLHERNKHSEDKERRMLQQCPQCDRECTTPALLRQHIRRMHTDRTKKYQCDHCKRFYWSKGEIRSHIVWSHAPSRGKRALFCCGREFRTRSRLKDHIAIHHLGHERERIHKCDQCDKAFANKQVLTRHKKSHADFTYPCPECGLRFKSGAYVKVHQQLKHLNMTRAEIKALKQARKAPPKGLRPLSVAPGQKGLRPLSVTPNGLPPQSVTPNLKDSPNGLPPLSVTPNLKDSPKGLGPLSVAPNLNDLSSDLKGLQRMPLNEPEDLSVRKMSFETVLVKQEVDSENEYSVPLFDLEDLKSKV